MSLKNILVYLTHPHVEAWNFKSIHRVMLENLVPGLSVEVCQNFKEFRERLPDAEAVIVWFFKDEWVAPNLKLLATPSAGRDWVELNSGKNARVSFGSFHGSLIAESVIGAMLYFLKAFPLSVNMQSQKKWARVKISRKLESLYKNRITILGFGNIGNVIAERLKPFGCIITGIRRSAITKPKYFSDSDQVLAFEKWEMVFKETDHLICALPGGEHTDNILKLEHFKALPRNCYFYNVGRGNIYKEDELISVLRKEEIAGAYLDVFKEEPLSENSKLWEMKNILIQPHLSSASPQYLKLFVEELAGRINSGKWFK